MAEAGGYEAVAHLLATTDISDMNLSDRPRWTDEKALACDMATKQDVLDVLQVIEESTAWCSRLQTSSMCAVVIGSYT